MSGFDSLRQSCRGHAFKNPRVEFAIHEEPDAHCIAQHCTALHSIAKISTHQLLIKIGKGTVCKGARSRAGNKTGIMTVYAPSFSCFYVLAFCARS